MPSAHPESTVRKREIRDVSRITKVTNVPMPQDAGDGESDQSPGDLSASVPGIWEPSR